MRFGKWHSHVQNCRRSMENLTAIEDARWERENEIKNIMQNWLMFANGEGKCAQNSPNHFTRTTATTSTMTLCRTILNFRRSATNRYSFAYKSKQNNWKFCESYPIRPVAAFHCCIHMRALLLRFSIHSISSTIIILSCTSVCVVQINWISSEMAMRTQHTRAYTYFRLQFPYHRTTKKTATAQNYTGRRFPCRTLKRVHIYGFSIQISFAFIDRRKKNALKKCYRRRRHTCQASKRKPKKRNIQIYIYFFPIPSYRMPVILKTGALGIENSQRRYWFLLITLKFVKSLRGRAEYRIISIMLQFNGETCDQYWVSCSTWCSLVSQTSAVYFGSPGCVPVIGVATANTLVNLFIFFHFHFSRTPTALA